MTISPNQTPLSEQVPDRLLAAFSAWMEAERQLSQAHMDLIEDLKEMLS